jgi:molybdopterin-guanine dinucleotide biosynthesis protein A
VTGAAGRACVGAILAGGAASRMGGQAKGLLQVGTSRIADRVADALATTTERLLIASNDADWPEWRPEIPRVGDVRPGFGPLSGIHAALVWAQCDVLVAAWDMPLLPAGLLAAMRRAGEARDALVVAPASGSPWGFEPLCAWYARRALPLVEAQLDAGDARTGTLAERAGVVVMDVSSWGDPDELFLSVNAPDDLRRAEAIVARGLAAPRAPR